MARLTVLTIEKSIKKAGPLFKYRSSLFFILNLIAMIKLLIVINGVKSAYAIKIRPAKALPKIYLPEGIRLFAGWCVFCNDCGPRPRSFFGGNEIGATTRFAQQIHPRWGTLLGHSSPLQPTNILPGWTKKVGHVSINGSGSAIITSALSAMSAKWVRFGDTLKPTRTCGLPTKTIPYGIIKAG